MQNIGEHSLAPDTVKEAIKLAEMCNGWEADIRAKEMSKGGKIELHLKNRKEEVRVVIATLLKGSRTRKTQQLTGA